jgi:hypothetical protein
MFTRPPRTSEGLGLGATHRGNVRTDAGAHHSGPSNHGGNLQGPENVGLRIATCSPERSPGCADHHGTSRVPSGVEGHAASGRRRSVGNAPSPPGWHRRRVTGTWTPARPCPRTAGSTAEAAEGAMVVEEAAGTAPDRRRPTVEVWRAGQDSNLRPSAPEADALSTELPARAGGQSYPRRRGHRRAPPMGWHARCIHHGIGPKDPIIGGCHVLGWRDHRTDPADPADPAADGEPVDPISRSGSSNSGAADNVNGQGRRPLRRGAFPLLPDSLTARASFTRGFPHYPNPNLPMTLRSVVNRCANSEHMIGSDPLQGQRFGTKIPLHFRADFGPPGVIPISPFR